jgi:acyl-CoA reductase-like NAD-dependent aldehyde dehydrogenase
MTRGASSKPAERRLLLVRLTDLVARDIEAFAALDTLDIGAPTSRTRNNRQRALGMLRFCTGMATALHGETIDNSLPGEYVSFTLKEPVGVVGAIIPWNGPLTATIWKIGPALATGCTVVLKPAEEAQLTRCAWESCAWRQVFRHAWSISCLATAKPLAPRWPRIRTWTRSRSPARILPGCPSFAHPPAT